MTGIPGTAHHGGLTTVVRRVLWLAGLLLGLWLLSWIVADEARADGLPVNIPVVDQVVRPVVPDVDKVVRPVVPDVGKVLDQVTKPVEKVVQGLEKGPVSDLVNPVVKIVDTLPAPLPDVVTPIIEPVGSAAGGLTPAPGALPPTSPATPVPSAPGKVKPVHAVLTTTVDAPAKTVATAESSAKTVVDHDFRIPVPDKAQQPKTVLLNHSAHHPTGHVPLSERSDAPVEPGQAPATTVNAAGSVAAVVAHDPGVDLTAPGRLIRPHGVFAPLWRSLKPGTSPG